MDDNTQEELQKILDEVQILDDHLPNPLALNNSIGELERTAAAYDRLESEDR